MTEKNKSESATKTMNLKAQNYQNPAGAGGGNPRRRPVNLTSVKSAARSTRLILGTILPFRHRKLVGNLGDLLRPNNLALAVEDLES